MLSSPEDLTPERLTALLYESRLLTQGVVASIQREPVAGQFGKPHQLSRIHVEYSDAGSQAPSSHFFLKFGKSSKEVFFYNTIATTMPAWLLPGCYYAAHDPQSNQACLLLEDLAETHFQTDWPLPPSADLCFQIVRDLAQIHALWWQSPRLENEFCPALPPDRSWSDRRALAVEKLPAFLTFLGDRISPSRRQTYERLLNSPARLWKISAGAPNQTLLHGDLHAWNVFYPRHPDGGLRFFDWNMWDVGYPTDDLAYLMAVHWYPERRKRLEQDLLNAYHHKLVECGIMSYSRDDLQQDYRLSIIRSLLIPVWQWVRGIHPGIWWSHLERILLAFEDLECCELC